MRDDQQQHGTVAGYRAHRRNREPACQPCKTAETQERRERLARDAESVELTGGRWVNVRGVMRWQPDMPQLAAQSDARGDAVCACGARAAESCRTKNGVRTSDHAYRLAPRTCPCGAQPRPRSIYCQPCREQLKREQKANNKEARRSWAA